MAETAGSIARSMLGGAISMATSATTVEMGLLLGVRKDILFIKHELETMRAFLEVYEVMEKKDELVKVWVKQIRDLSYDIEDCLSEFMVHVASQNLAKRLMKLKDRHRIAMWVHDLKSNVEEVSSRNTRYSLIKREASSTISKVDSYAEDVHNHSASNIDEAELVGFSKRKEELIKLMDVNSKDGIVKVICIVGMGGLGKTTLAKKTYEDIVKNFSCCAWITDSQISSKIEMLKDMIMQLLGHEELKKRLKELEGKAVQVDDLATYLRGKLEDKRYLIILDDLSTIETWNWIKSMAFPSSYDKGSRIIVTTRDVGLARQFTLESLIYRLEPLELVDATNLLLRKTKKTQEDIDKDENLKKLVEKLVTKCGCLPLAILTIGGILVNKRIDEWGHIYNQLPSELESNPSLEAMRRMVTLSYNHLPYHLKSCFLYLSIFPEDFEIQRRRLVDRWIAEGFVRARDGVSIEDAGKGYFGELINRSMILPSRVDIEGSVKSCRVHDIMRDVMVSISRDENFVYLARDNIARVAEENFRHVAYHGSKRQKIQINWSRVRSLTVFGNKPMELSPSVFSLDLRILRVLDLADIGFKITQKDIDNIGLLLHLKYVNVRRAGYYSYIYKLPRSIGKLQGLVTLDIRDSYITTLPTKINKLQSLRSLRCSRRDYFHYYVRDGCNRYLTATFSLPRIFTPLVNPDERAERIAELHMACSSRWSESEGVKVPRGIRNLNELQILEIVDIRRTSRRAIKELGELMQLRKLSVATNGATEQKCKIFCAAVEKLSSLCSLNVDASCNGTVEWVHCISSPPPLLRTLKLYGPLREMPDWVRSLMRLVKIQLRGSLLQESMEIVGALPNLMLLRLLDEAYVGEKLVFRAGAFPNLRKLEIDSLGQLREVRFEEGTSPWMERIEICYCDLKSGIVGIKHLPSLKEISLGSNGRVAKLGVLEVEVKAHPNHPVLRLRGDRGVVQGSNAVRVEATEELLLADAAAGERSQVVMSTTNGSEDDLFYTYNSC